MITNAVPSIGNGLTSSVTVLIDRLLLLVFTTWQAMLAVSALGLVILILSTLHRLMS